MSMSQEEIEALMGGTETPKDENLELENLDSLNTGDVINTDEEVKLANTKKESLNSEAQKVLDSVNRDLEKRDETLKQAYSPESSSLSNEEDQEINNLDEKELQKMQEELVQATPTPTKEEKKKSKNDAIGKTWTNNKIEEGVFPLPVEKNHQVVNQLSEVANDSEENASKIFDILSYILDENNEIEADLKKLATFCQGQKVLLEVLSSKFPHINIFKTNLEQITTMQTSQEDISKRVTDENNSLFQAMELMQFHDINRQKIERVMAVIRKLSSYLSNLFEDDHTHPDIAVAKHIHGDDNEELVGDEDLSALIAEFGNKGDSK